MQYGMPQLKEPGREFLFMYFLRPKPRSTSQSNGLGATREQPKQQVILENLTPNSTVLRQEKLSAVQRHTSADVKMTHIAGRGQKLLTSNLGQLLKKPDEDTYTGEKIKPYYVAACYNVTGNFSYAQRNCFYYNFMIFLTH